MNEVILVCYCPGMDKRAEAAFKVVSKGKPIPKMYKGRYGIADFVSSLQKRGIDGDIIAYSKALAKNNNKFAYYMRWNDSGDVTVQYNLMSGRRTK